MNVTRRLRRLCSVALVSTFAVALNGCAAIDHLFCAPDCGSTTQSSSSLVDFLYPDGKAPPREDALPELRVPLRVGLAFLPAHDGYGASGITAAQREDLMDKVRQRFVSRKFVADIVAIPDYYLKQARGFQGLQGVQRLYNVDVMALVSYDQVTHMQDNNWSWGYLTIAGAYFLKGSRHDVTTLVDLAVVDPATRSLILRAGGTDTRHGNTTLIDQNLETRTASAHGFDAATAQMVEHFDSALAKFESDVRAGTAPVRIVKRRTQRFASTGGGGGAMQVAWLGVLLLLAAMAIGRSNTPAACQTDRRRVRARAQ